MLQGGLHAASQGSGVGRGSPGFLGGLVWHPTLRSVPSASVGVAAFFVQMEGKLTAPSLPPSLRLPEGSAGWKSWLGVFTSTWRMAQS